MAPAREHDRGASERKCIATGDVCPPETLVRFVLDPDGVVTPDLAAKLPGRGAWTRASRDAVIAAASKGLFAHALKSPARLPANATPESLAVSVEAGLEQRALSAFGLARRAGKAHLGFDQADDALRARNAAVLVIALDASPGVGAKLVRLANEAVIVTAFTVDALSAAAGRENVTYAVIEPGLEAARFLREAARLAGFRKVFAQAEAETAELA